MLLHRSSGPEATYLPVNKTSYNQDLYLLCWSQTVAALSYVFENAEEKTIVLKAINGFRSVVVLVLVYCGYLQALPHSKACDHCTKGFALQCIVVKIVIFICTLRGLHAEVHIPGRKVFVSAESYQSVANNIHDDRTFPTSHPPQH